MRGYLAGLALVIAMAYLVVGIGELSGGTLWPARLGADQATQLVIGGSVLLLAVQQTPGRPGMAALLEMLAGGLAGNAASPRQADLYGFAAVAMGLGVVSIVAAGSLLSAALPAGESAGPAEAGTLARRAARGRTRRRGKSPAARTTQRRRPPSRGRTGGVFTPADRRPGQLKRWRRATGQHRRSRRDGRLGNGAGDAVATADAVGGIALD